MEGREGGSGRGWSNDAHPFEGRHEDPRQGVGWGAGGSVGGEGGQTKVRGSGGPPFIPLPQPPLILWTSARK